MKASRLDVRVVALREEALGVVSCELRAESGTLPPCPAGAHVDVHLPNGIVRQYSVAATPRGCYLIAVKREPASRGGSAFVADSLRIGTRLSVSHPRQNFPLLASGGPVVLLAGGIGITAILPMAVQLEAERREWVLHHVVRSPEHAAFADRLEAFGDRVTMHVSRGSLLLSALVDRYAADAHFYCCGPASMLDDFAAATARLAPDRVHFERFNAVSATPGNGFTVRLARSGTVVPVGADQTIIEALASVGIDAPYSCQQGICGSCETRVLAGVPDHRDEVLSEAEKASNGMLMICCSRARSAELVLDL